MSPGLTAAEVRELVFEYFALPHGSKGRWLVQRGLSAKKMSRWRAAVFDGDVDRSLIARDGGSMTVPPNDRAPIARARAAERAAHEAEVARLSARIRELEETSDALGKAIGLLHQLSEREPTADPVRPDPSDSSTPRPASSND